MSEDFDYMLYGPRLTGAPFVRFIDHLYEGNVHRLAAGQQPVPCCIWGRHGIGKTQSMRDFAARRKVGFVQINPAQFEEMGDITGMPQVHDPGTPGDWTDDVTVYVMPDWAKEMHRQGPEGILLMDDFNRADGRIIRGIMQLLQDRRMVSWALPERWQIFLTANPDGGDYAVTPVDDAVLTRMSHVTLQFDHRAWADWARAHGIDDRGIAFVVGYPELVGSSRTTPRSLVNLFSQLSRIPSLVDEIELVDALARSCIDAESADAFVGFVRHSLSDIPTPEEILDCEDFARDLAPRIARSTSAPGKGDSSRADILAIVLDRLVSALSAAREPLQGRRRANAIALLTWDRLPADLRFATLQRLVRAPAADFLDDPAIVRFIERVGR
jgi:hypothetical protein